MAVQLFPTQKNQRTAADRFGRKKKKTEPQSRKPTKTEIVWYKLEGRLPGGNL